MDYNNRFISFLKVMGLVLIPLVLIFTLMECSKHKSENERLSHNQDILLHNGEVEIGQTSDGKATASSTALQLRASELKRKPDSLLAVTQQKIKVKNSRLVAAARTATSTEVKMNAPIISVSDSDTLLHVTWSDPWVRLDGFIRADTLHAKIESRDTLQMIVHRVPKRFLFFRFGTKAVRMDVVSQNPHTKLSYPRLILLDK